MIIIKINNMKTIKSINDFILTEKKMTVKEYNDNIGLCDSIEDNENNILLVYDNVFCFEITSEGKYSLCLDRSEYLEEDFFWVINLLWDWAKYELNQKLTEDEIQEDLHERARELMINIDEDNKRDSKFSLDEYLLEFNHTEEERNKIEYLLRQFEEL